MSIGQYLQRHSWLSVDCPGMVAVCRFVDRDMMMRYHWGYGVGHSYTFASDLGQENCQQLVDDNDGDIGNGEKTCDTAEADDGTSDGSDSSSWSDDGELQDENIADCDSNSDEESQYLIDAMYDSDSHEEYSF